MEHEKFDHLFDFLGSDDSDSQKQLLRESNAAYVAELRKQKAKPSRSRPARSQPNPAKSKEDKRNQIVERWGEEVAKRGWFAAPLMLFEYQARLELKDVEMVVLMHLLKHWRSKDKPPFPSIKRIADLMGKKSHRSVQQILSRLANHPGAKKLTRYDGYILVQPRRDFDGDGRQTSNIYHLYPLVEALEVIAAEQNKSEEEAKKRKPNSPLGS